MNNTVKVSVASAIIAFGLIASSYTLSRFYLRLEKEKLITVKGFSRKRLISDKASLAANITVQGPSIAEAYEALQSQGEEIISLIKANKISTFTVDNADLDKEFKRNARGDLTNEIDYYILSQTFRVESTDVQKIETTAAQTGGLLAKGYQVSIYGPDYYITDLSGIKMELLGQATSDGYKRALLMAENSGGKVGKLVEAQQGIFQITEPDSTEISGYGVYDTNTIEKDIKAVVTLKYLIE